MANFPTVPPLSDLLTGCLQNRRQSQELLYQQFYRYAMSICLRYTPTQEKAFEVLNDGFLKVFTQLDHYDPDQPFENWLRRILIDTAVDHYRHKVRHYPNDENNDQIKQVIVYKYIDKINQLNHENLLALIQQLSPAHRMVFNLYVMDGLTHDEIASQLGISVGASRSNLAHAREKLRLLLKQLNYDEYVRANR